MPKYWMVSDRAVDVANKAFGDARNSTGLTYWVSDGALSIDDPKSWTNVTAADFETAVLDVVNTFPAIIDPAHQQDQKHITLFIHGYNNKWTVEAARYQTICNSLFDGPDSMGLCIWFDWPSKGTALGYLPDRRLAEECAPDLADVLQKFYNLLIGMEQTAAANPNDPNSVCRAKTSIIAHSMGNYLLQRGMYLLWRRINQPLLVSLVNQLLMVAADVDNDLFKSGESIQNTDGDAIANLTYRVTALYSGLDAVLGSSAGLKHFGKRRLGRSGLDPTCPISDNIWDVDCTPLLPDGALYDQPWSVHSIYFTDDKIINLMRELLRGLDRSILVSRGIAPAPPKTTV
jgi:esterase/lipase superfamily enzyme